MAPRLEYVPVRECTRWAVRASLRLKAPSKITVREFCRRVGPVVAAVAAMKSATI